MKCETNNCKEDACIHKGVKYTLCLMHMKEYWNERDKYLRLKDEI